MPITGDRLRSLNSAVRRHRRVLAVAAASLAAWALVSELKPAAPSEPVVVASRPVPAGTRLSQDDVRTVPWHESAGRTPGLLNDTAQAVGRVVSVALPADSVVPSFALVSPASIAGRSGDDDGTVAVGVRPFDPLISSLLAPGDRVDVWATPQSALGGASGRQPSRIGAGVRVLTVVRATSAAAAGPLGAGGSGSGSSLVLLAVPQDRVAAFARANAGDAITLAVLSGQAQ